MYTSSTTSGGMTAGSTYGNVPLAADPGQPAAVANHDADRLHQALQRYPAAQGGLLPPHHRVRC